MPKFFHNNKLKFQENSSSALQQSINWIKWEVVFKKNPTVGLPEASKLTDPAINVYTNIYTYIIYDENDSM